MLKNLINWWRNRKSIQYETTISEDSISTNGNKLTKVVTLKYHGPAFIVIDGQSCYVPILLNSDLCLNEVSE